ncbi:hypothetical protein EV194_11337 [Natronoflexus pectinivorans]|uniref:Uncharacterized protein n=1 Tax=Natronoflexus pectinivorans TaxID=682526 RepID=A0A4R2GEF1_9BACT|nr:hypothetical protein EV194_11337 [Natronoflexus pectinivorans]
MGDGGEAAITLSNRNSLLFRAKREIYYMIIIIKNTESDRSETFYYIAC